MQDPESKGWCGVQKLMGQWQVENAISHTSACKEIGKDLGMKLY